MVLILPNMVQILPNMVLRISDYYFQTLRNFVYRLQGHFLLFILFLLLNKFFMNEGLRSLRLSIISTVIVLSLCPSIEHLPGFFNKPL